MDDYCGWTINAAIVEALDVAASVRLILHRDAVLKWVREQGIHPKLAMGALVSVNILGKLEPGEIVGIDEDCANYTVCIPGLGHVREGMGTHGIILSFEHVEGGS